MFIKVQTIQSFKYQKDKTDELFINVLDIQKIVKSKKDIYFWLKNDEVFFIKFDKEKETDEYFLKLRKKIIDNDPTEILKDGLELIGDRLNGIEIKLHDIRQEINKDNGYLEDL